MDLLITNDSGDASPLRGYDPLHRHQSLPLWRHRHIAVPTCMGPCKYHQSSSSHPTVPLSTHVRPTRSTACHTLTSRFHPNHRREKLPHLQHLQAFTVPTTGSHHPNLHTIPNPKPKENMRSLAKMHHVRGTSCSHMVLLGSISWLAVDHAGQTFILSQHEEKADSRTSTRLLW